MSRTGVGEQLLVLARLARPRHERAGSRTHSEHRVLAHPSAPRSRGASLRRSRSGSPRLRRRRRCRRASPRRGSSPTSMPRPRWRSRPTAGSSSPSRAAACASSRTGRCSRRRSSPCTVDPNGERGLLGVAIDPAFASNGYVYVYYTATTPNTHNRVSRFTASGDVAVAGSERVLLDLNPLSVSAQPQRRRPPLRQGRQALRCRRRQRQLEQRGDARQPAREDPAHQLGRLDPDRQPVLQHGDRPEPRDLGATGSGIRSRSPSSPAPAGCSSTTSGRGRGRRSTTASPARTTAGRPRRARAATRASGTRSSTTATATARRPAARSRAARSTTRRPGSSRPSTSATTSSPTTAPAGSGSSIRRTATPSSTSPSACPGAGRPRRRQRRQPLLPLPVRCRPRLPDHVHGQPRADDHHPPGEPDGQCRRPGDVHCVGERRSRRSPSSGSGTAINISGATSSSYTLRAAQAIGQRRPLPRPGVERIRERRRATRRRSRSRRTSRRPRRSPLRPRGRRTAAAT